MNKDIRGPSEVIATSQNQTKTLTITITRSERQHINHNLILNVFILNDTFCILQNESVLTRKLESSTSSQNLAFFCG